MRIISIIIVSAISGIVLFVVGLWLFASSINVNRDESHIIFYDESYKSSFIEALNENNIPYRREGDDSIYYPVKYQKAIDEIKTNISSNYPRQFSVYKESMIKEFSRKLNEAGIPYEMYDIENGKSFVIGPEYGRYASELFNLSRI